MKYLLDTNICIYLIKKKPVSVIARFDEHSVGDMGVSSITVAELSYGAQKSQRQKQNQAALLQFLSPLVIAEFNSDATFSYGQIRADLESRRTPIGSLDTLIAAHAVSIGVNLVTYNEREFSRVSGLIVENWAEK
jgi:tRNA(fMet)-specific endonuclease VapC